MKNTKFFLFLFSLYHLMLGFLYAFSLISNTGWDLSVWGMLCAFISFLLLFCGIFAQPSLYFKMGTSLLIILTLCNEIQPLYAWSVIGHVGFISLHVASYFIGALCLFFMFKIR